MSSVASPVVVIARKDIRDAIHNRFILVVTAFMLVASVVALTVAAIALKTDVATYNEARDALIALGKSVGSVASPEFYPLRLLRGFIEHVEIIGAVIGILIGYRAAANERGRQTLALIVTRPVTQAQFLLGKVFGSSVLVVAGFAGVFAAAAMAVYFISGVGLGASDFLRLGIVLLAACLYAISFVLLGFILALWMKSLPNALLAAFIVWLILVLVAPQIGDTLDPDNQVAGGVFKQLNVPKPQQLEILKSFSSYEAIRTGIEAASPTKHFERLSFAILGIKDIYNGQPLVPVLWEKSGDILWLFASAAALLLLLFTRRLDFTRLSKD
jgi:ABC-2 type transport system permease protein